MPSQEHSAAWAFTASMHKVVTLIKFQTKIYTKPKQKTEHVYLKMFILSQAVN